MTGVPCPGSCNAGYRRAQAEYRRALAVWATTDPVLRGDRPAEPAVRPVPGQPVWCGRCASRIRQALAELDDLAALLAASADGYPAGPGEHVGGSPDPASPSPAADVVEELWSTLHRWETAYRGTDPQARRGWLADALTTTVAWLGHHLDGLLAHPDIAPDFGREVLDWHRRLVDQVRAGTDVHRKRVPCPRCGWLTLTWREGDDHVACQNRDCGRLLTLDEYDEHAAAQVRHARDAG